MSQIFVRTASTFVTVLIAVAISTTFGDSGWSKVLAALLIAVFILLVEWALDWTPKHFSLARNLLDPRARMIGVWIQKVEKSEPKLAITSTLNSFAIHWVEYRDDAYRVAGYVFDESATPIARFESTNAPTFSRDGTIMTYLWEAVILGDSPELSNLERTGVTRITIYAGGREGRGQLDTLGENRRLFFNIELASSETLVRYGFKDWTPEDLKKEERREQFAMAYAKELHPQA